MASEHLLRYRRGKQRLLMLCLLKAALTSMPKDGLVDLLILLLQTKNMNNFMFNIIDVVLKSRL